MLDDRAAGAAELDTAFAGLDPLGRLRLIADRMPGRVVFTTSLGIEDQMLTHLIFANGLPIDVVTLDTGRLFPETYTLWRETEERYGRRIKALYPQAEALEALVADQGIDGFYMSVDCRKACCGVRKVEPLGRALKGASAWITGLRRDQSASRGTLDYVSFDAQRGLVKANPIFDWTRDEIAAFTTAERVPVNGLHAQGFLSIGCAPCTRAVHPGEPERAGRWWWEDEARKECGLHVDESGRVTRAQPSSPIAGARPAHGDAAFESLPQ
ncbi:phosphoadenylyl-sulfate reductase [Mangrovibrevibacter kandeliae]|uniref:phosphoadenylyl-sulfate reductase n=1 Tax=Mangrovibrevibacter kandeliae TaxID=2968473 RepID=UPI002117E549|nr:phosphoadenylyl-sulfate reductase [Aurantimonas sp. CSK15Z-1]MCQ8781971.1 phosphoadenylyl-sulfate reductase [Aurantimonas sp. CSK15Z-1]